MHISRITQKFVPFNLKFVKCYVHKKTRSWRQLAIINKFITIAASSFLKYFHSSRAYLLSPPYSCEVNEKCITLHLFHVIISRSVQSWRANKPIHFEVRDDLARTGPCFDWPWRRACAYIPAAVWGLGRAHPARGNARQSVRLMW